MEHRFGTVSNELHADIYGWWRITETSQWVNRGLDALGPALISITGRGDRLRMHCLLATVNVRATKTGASFTWEGAWGTIRSAAVGASGSAKTVGFVVASRSKTVTRALSSLRGRASPRSLSSILHPIETSGGRNGAGDFRGASTSKTVAARPGTAATGPEPVPVASVFGLGRAGRDPFESFERSCLTRMILS